MPRKSRKRTEEDIPQGFTLRCTLRGLLLNTECIRWSPGGSVLASGSCENDEDIIRLWDTQTGQPLGILTQHSADTICIAWSPDGSMLASGSYENDQGAIRLWNIHTRQPLRTLTEDSTSRDTRIRLSIVDAIAWSPDGSVLASRYGDGTIQLWDAQAGQLLRTLTEATRDTLIQSSTTNAIAWSPDGSVLASRYGDGTIQLWDAQAGQLLRTLTEATKPRDTLIQSSTINAIAWSPDGSVLASGSNDGIIRLWNSTTGQQIRTLEGHTGAITSISFSHDSGLLASKSNDETVRIWSTDTWESVAVLNTFDPYDNNFDSDLAFHPKSSALAIVTGDEGDCVIDIWDLDPPTLLKITPPNFSIHYTTAKIALVGDSGVGKSGLGYRIVEDRFRVTESTHGQQFWVIDKLGKTRTDGTQCEAVLWDFAGQPNFRPIHSLFLDDVDLALVLFDPSRPDTFTGVDYWIKQLSRNQRQCRTVLVAARNDVSELSLSSTELEAFCHQRNISGGFIATSAKTNIGIDALLEAMRQQIDWDTKPATVTTKTFKRIKDYMLSLKADADRKNVLVSLSQLRILLEKTYPDWQFSDAELITAVGHLQNHGYVTVLHRSSNKQSILLSPDVLINLAASYMLKAQSNEKGLGALEESRALRNEYRFREVEILSDDERDALLNAVTELFLDRNICFREAIDGQTFLIFPSLIFDRPPRLIEDAELVEDSAYIISGLIENIYPALVVLLGYSSYFQRTHQWHKQAQYETSHSAICSFKQFNDEPGQLELVLYYGKNTPDFTRLRFQGLFEEILYTRNVSVTRYPPILCPKCDRQQERHIVMRRMQEGKKFLFCDEDGEKINLPQFTERLVLNDRGNAAVVRDQILSKMRTTYETAIVRVKGFIRDRGDTIVPTCFVSYAWGDPVHERWVLGLTNDLRRADIDVLLDQLDNAVIGSSVPRFISSIEESDFIIVVGTPTYREKYENKVSKYGSVVAAEVDLINIRLIGTEEQKASILPLLLAEQRDGKHNSFPPMLQGRVYADFTSEGNYFFTLFDLVLTLYRIPFDDPVVDDLRTKLRDEAKAFTKKL